MWHFSHFSTTYLLVTLIVFQLCRHCFPWVLRLPPTIGTAPPLSGFSGVPLTSSLLFLDRLAAALRLAALLWFLALSPQLTAKFLMAAGGLPGKRRAWERDPRHSAARHAGRDGDLARGTPVGSNRRAPLPRCAPDGQRAATRARQAQAARVVMA